jgi:WD40 repeat protein
LQVWDWERRSLLREWIDPSGTATGYPRQFSADGKKLSTALFNRGAFSYRELDIASGRAVVSIDLPDSGLRGRSGLELTPDKTQLVLWSSSSNRFVWVDVPSGRTSTLELAMTEAASGGPAWSPDRRWMAWTSYYGYARVFDAATLQTVTTLRGFMFGVHSCAFLPDGSRLAVGGTAFEAFTLWDSRSFERLLSLPAYAASMHGMTISADGNVIAARTGTESGKIYFWRAPTWEEIAKAEAAGKPAP